MKKYNIVKVDLDYKTNILKTFMTHGEAIEYLSSLIDQEYKKEDNANNYKIYYDSKDSITIKYIGYLSTNLECKYFIIEYDDDTMCVCGMYYDYEDDEEETYTIKKNKN